MAEDVPTGIVIEPIVEAQIPDIDADRQRKVDALVLSMKDNPAAMAEIAGKLVELQEENTELKRENAEMRPLVERDTLCPELLNKRGWERALSEDSDRIVRGHLPFAVLVTDIDNFKHGINDRFGHKVGDLVIQHFGKALGKMSRESDKKARPGGDECAALLMGIDKKGAETIAERIRQEFKTPVESDHPLKPYIDQGLELDVSIGLKHFDWNDDEKRKVDAWPRRDHDQKRLSFMSQQIEDADRNMYEVKRDRKGRHNVGEPLPN